MTDQEKITRLRQALSDCASWLETEFEGQELDAENAHHAVLINAQWALQTTEPARADH